VFVCFCEKEGSVISLWEQKRDCCDDEKDDCCQGDEEDDDCCTEVEEFVKVSLDFMQDAPVYALVGIQDDVQPIWNFIEIQEGNVTPSTISRPPPMRGRDILIQHQVFLI